MPDYYYHSSHKIKERAKAEAKKQRNKGYYAITKKIMRGSYMVYRSKKKKKR